MTPTAPLAGRWRILAILFLARTTMAIQFQAAAALSPLMMERFGVGLADIGLALGLYLAPGIIIALPGGALGHRFGEKTVVTAGLVLMVAGGCIMAAGPGWGAQMVGRILAGTGGVLLNVLMTKMVADWFDPTERATAMGIFVNSWPVGIAFALLALPAISVVAGYSVTLWAVTGAAVLALILFVRLYHSAPDRSALTLRSDNSSRAMPRGGVLWATVAAGGVWGLYNGGLAMVFGFTPAMLTERGYSAATAGSNTSLVLWIAAIVIPFGGYLADKTGRRDAVILGGLVAFGVCLWLGARDIATTVVFIATGLVAGLPAGPIMSLPGTVLTPATSAVGMGIFFAIYYVLALVLPAGAGWLAERAGSAAVTFDAGLVMLAAAVMSLLLFNRLAQTIQ